MHATRTPAQQAAAHASDTPHCLRGGPFALLPGEDRAQLSDLHAAVTSDWGPRDAYERRWVMELVACLLRQERLRALELATLTAAAAASPPAEATVKQLLAFARYGARIDKDIGRALQALRVLRDRPDAWIDELRNGTEEPDAPKPQQQIFTNECMVRSVSARLGWCGQVASA